jgi:hypothetical protein
MVLVMNLEGLKMFSSPGDSVHFPTARSQL